MGDRANVRVISNKKSVYLYTHWGGTELPQTVQAALQRRQRWTDAPYLTRIIFSTMIVGAEQEETGFGISAEVCDGADRVITVNCDTQQVSLKGRTWSFEEFIELPAVGWWAKAP